MKKRKAISNRVIAVVLAITVMNPARLRRVGACRKLTFPDEPDKI